MQRQHRTAVSSGRPRWHPGGNLVGRSEPVETKSDPVSVQHEGRGFLRGFGVIVISSRIGTTTLPGMTSGHDSPSDELLQQHQRLAGFARPKSRGISALTAMALWATGNALALTDGGYAEADPALGDRSKSKPRLSTCLQIGTQPIWTLT